MKIENPRYITVQGYPVLEVEVDGQTLRFDSEQKATLVKNRLVPNVPGRTAQLPDGTEMKDVSDNSELFKLVTAFGLACYYGRFREGPAFTEVNPSEFAALMERLK